MICKKCGKKLPDNALFCSKCGSKLATKKKVFNGIKMILFGFILLCLAVYILISLFKNNTKNNVKEINLVRQADLEEDSYFAITGIYNPAVPNNKDDEWADGNGSYVYFGNFYQNNDTEKEPIKWRVLSVNTKDFCEENTMFLLSDKILAQVEFNQQRNQIEGSQNEWLGSDLRMWLNGSDVAQSQEEKGFRDNAFDLVEQSVIAYSSKTSGKRIFSEYYFGDNSGLSDDRIFVLSLEEARADKFGFFDTDGSSKSRVIEVTPYANKQGCKNSWWLRSNKKSYYNNNILIRTEQKWGDGNIVTTEANDKNVGVAPALNLRLKSIAFITDFNYVKGKFDVIEDIKESNGWKLTVFGGSGFRAEIDNSEPVKKGEGINVIVYEIGISQFDIDYTQISAMLVSKNNEVICYGSIADAAQKGSFELEIPNRKIIKQGNYSLFIFAEQVNSGNKNQCTDYVSNIVSIPIEIE